LIGHSLVAAARNICVPSGLAAVAKELDDVVLVRGSVQYVMGFVMHFFTRLPADPRYRRAGYTLFAKSPSQNFSKDYKAFAA
jgi:hypothetical protein